MVTIFSAWSASTVESVTTAILFTSRKVLRMNSGAYLQTPEPIVTSYGDDAFI
jgi:hypothetical protein